MTAQPARPATTRLNVFERYLSVWVGLCMMAGIAIGKAIPALTDGLRRLEFGQGSQIDIPIAVVIWLMIMPMMLKVDVAAIRDVRPSPARTRHHAHRELDGHVVNRTRHWFPVLA